MKYLFLALTILATNAHAFELMKCNSMENGTVWASFGKFWESGKDKPQYFPTEAVVFGKDFSARKVYVDLKEALKVEVEVPDAENRIRFNFTVTDGQRQQTHLLQIQKFDPSVPNGFMGNWTVSETGKKDQMGMAACTVN